MTEIDVTDRMEYLAKSFDVFDTSKAGLEAKIKSINGVIQFISSNTKNSNDELNTLAIVYKTHDEKINSKVTNVSVALHVFSNMITADPTPNKSCVQWMLTTFVRSLKKDSGIAAAKRFVEEDLPLASSYISLFEANKRKKKFKRFCSTSKFLENVKDPTDINQYKSLSQLYDAVDPFIERQPTELESLLLKYVSSGQALIPVKDRKYTMYIPLTTDASVVFSKFAGWCTAIVQNGMFTSYTSNHKTPDGKNSRLFIIINNKFFTGESQELYQLHFETKQIKDKWNHQVEDFFERVINESEIIASYFHDELLRFAKLNSKGYDDNIYLDFLVSFGFCDSLFELMNSTTPVIKFMSRDIPRLPDVSRFKDLEHIIITDAKMIELHESIGRLKNLEMLVVPNNRLKSIPKEIGLLKKLMFLNFVGNPIEDIPDEIKYLDKSNGGVLFRLAIRKEDVGEENYAKLKRLLPETIF